MNQINHYIIIGIIGIISGILCAQADVPLAWSGRKNDPIDAKAVGRITSWWTEVGEGHFDLSFWLSFIGQPGTYLTAWMLALLIERTLPALGLALKIRTAIAAYTGLLFHAAACIKPLVYRAVAGKGYDPTANCQVVSEGIAREAVDAVGKYPKIPSLVSGVCLFLITPAIVIYSILTGALDVPVYFVLFNPIGALPLLLIMRKLKIKIGGALGIGYALLAAVLIAAGAGL